MLFKFFSVISLLFFISTANSAGISLNQSRLVFLEKDKSQYVEVRNDTERALLVQASILNQIDGHAVNNFIVTPPLFKVEKNSEFSMRVVPNDISALPRDRESIFYFKVRSIPSIDKDIDDKSSLVFVTAFIIKLIYRPAEILNPTDVLYGQVNLIKEGGKWSFSNPTPHYMTVVGLQIDGKEIKETFLIEPFKNYPIGLNVNEPSTVSWYFLNDFGAITKKQTIQRVVKK